MLFTFTTYKPSILLVEDNKYLRRLLYNILEGKYKVYTAENGLDALLILKQIAAPSLIITDLIMPEMDGYELIKNIKSSGFYKHIPVFVITGNELDQIQEGLESLGVKSIFSKPFNPQKLLEQIHVQLVNNA
jgi:two-component system chemotaxis response regulator CheY